MSRNVLSENQKPKVLFVAMTVALAYCGTTSARRERGDAFGMGPPVTEEIVAKAVAEMPPIVRGLFEPARESVQRNYKVPDSFRDCKFGIFMHWGLYSMPENRQKVLLSIGKWLAVNGEGIYGTGPWVEFGESSSSRGRDRGSSASTNVSRAYGCRFSTKSDTLYAIALGWPGKQAVITSLAKGADASGKMRSVTLLGHEGELKFTQDEEGLKADMAAEPPGEYASALGIARAAADKMVFKFDFGSGRVEPGYTQILSSTVYTEALGYGFESGSQVTAIDRGGDDALRCDFCASEKPFLFSVKLPEGNYRVTLTLGDQTGESATAVKAELRRLMLERVQTAPGEFETREITVNIRTPMISTGGQVRLKDREKTTEFAAWDDKLTLEFNDARPCVCALEIAGADDLPTVYILGDSTVCDQPLEPWNSWGQMLTRFLNSDVAVANHAESGESLRSSLGARRLDKVMSLMKPGDYLFIQFGHNDMKSRSPNALETYRSDLKRFVANTREHGGTPVLVTSMHRRSLDSEGGMRNTLGKYPETVRRVAKEDNVALIDLHSMSASLYEALGPQDIRKAFQDGTHHNNYGSYQLAKCVVEGIRQNKLDLTRYIVDDYQGYDPNHPDPVDSFSIPASPERSTRVPDSS